MLNKNLFYKFCKERNIRDTTKHGYESAIKKYESYYNMDIESLLKEAFDEEKLNIPMKKRKIKTRLVNYRSYLLNDKISPNTAKTYFSKIKTFYSHYEIELPILPEAKYKQIYEINYLDLPTKKHIRQALDIVPIDMKAIILFMSSSGTAKAETLSLKVKDFIKGTKEYHDGGHINEILNKLERKDDVIPTFYLKRQKTDKYYYTFCSPEAVEYIIRYLKTRKNLKAEDPLFDFSSSLLISKFQEINDKLDWGFKGNYRFFRSHTLRKFHASNIGLSAEYVDSLQGRSKNQMHETYIKINPEKMKKIYKKAMKNILIYDTNERKVNKKEEFHITINIFLGDNNYHIL